MGEVAVPRPRVRRAVGSSVDVTVAGEAGVLTVGRDQHGAPCWVQLRAGVHGSAVAGIADALATAITIGLQHGIPAAALTDALRRPDLGAPGDQPTDLLAETFTETAPAAMVSLAGR